MLNFLTFRKHSWALLLAMALAHFAWAGGPACTQLFKTEEDKWPPASWERFLEFFPDPASRHPLVERFHPKATIPQPYLDARFYSLHQHRRLFTQVEREKFKNPVPELNLPESNYEYLGMFRRDIERSLLGPVGRFFLVKNKQTQRVLSIPGGFRRPDGIQPRVFIKALNEYLERLEQISATGKTDPRLDYFFSILEHLERESPLNPDLTVINEPWRKLSGATLTSIRDRRIEKVITDSFDSGDTKRVAIRESYRQGDLWITVIDSHLERATVSVRNEAPATEEEMKRGRKVRRAWLNEIVAAIYPEYVERRKWSQDFIEHDYEEVLASADRTRYIVIRADDGSGNPGSILASVGLNRAPYSSSIWFEGSSEGWVETHESSGNHFLRDFPGAAFMERDSTGSGARLSHLPVLKMENYLGVHLERPIAIDSIYWDTSGQLMNGKINTKLPHFSGEGIIYEPVKFYLSPSSQMKNVALTELVAVLANSLFPSYQDPRFSLHAQWLYTFNPLREGQLLYAKRGYATDSRYQSVHKDGTEWHIFGQSPGEFLAKFHKLSGADKETAAGQFLLSLQQTAKALGRK